MKKIKNLSEGNFLKLLFAFFAAAFLIASVCMHDRKDIFTGLWNILSQPSKISANYFAMGGLSATFLNMGLVGLISLLLFGRHGGMVYEWIGTAIFSLFIGYDWARANTCARTVKNAIDLSSSLYLDIVNLFLRLLQMMSRNKK